MRITMTLGLSALMLAPAPAMAADAKVSFEIAKRSAKTYRKPYVAVWLEDANGKQVKVLKVLHDQHRIGPKWLPELKTWWRRGGRGLDMPADGISSPTRAPGRHTVDLGSMRGIKAGKYAIVVEATREKGGRDIVKVPFNWKPGGNVNASAGGKSELGKVSVQIKS